MIEYRDAEGKQDRITSLVTELVQIKVEVHCLSEFTKLFAQRSRQPKTIPIVMVVTVDPVATGLIDSLARPGGNVTGVTRLTRELSGKRLELVKEVLPKVSHVAVLWDAEAISCFKDYEIPAARVEVQASIP